MKTRLNELTLAVRHARSVLICSHVQPDGDAVGSMLALGEAVEALGKTCALALQDPVPDALGFLPGSERIVSPEALSGRVFDLGISVDASDLERLGNCAPVFRACRRTAQMDHHLGNNLPADISLVDVDAAATGVLVLRYVDAAGVTVSPLMAVCLYTAISTDTGNFCYGALSEETFSGMARLMRSGFPLVETARQVHLMRERGQVLLLGRALASLRFLRDGRLTAMHLDRQDFAASGALAQHADGLVNYGLYMPGVELSYLATETEDGIRMSLRCLAPHNVARVAASFGGGGHAFAAGCLLKEPLETALARMDTALLSLLRP